MKALAAGYKVLAGPNDKGETSTTKAIPHAPGRAGRLFPAAIRQRGSRAHRERRCAAAGSFDHREGARRGPNYIYSLITGFGQSRRPASR